MSVQPCNSIIVTKIIICLPTELLRVLKNSLKHVNCAFQIELEFGRLVCREREKQEYPEKHLSEQREKTNNKFNPHYGINTGI